MKTETAYFSAGCFWSVEKKFGELRGVKHTKVGYMGGKTKNPKYEDVLTGETGHAETIQVVYNPKKISYVDLLTFFFSMHDPTTKDKQGVDVGSQYRSIVFYKNKKQKADYQKVFESLPNKEVIVTELLRKSRFYKAEEYHQKYLEKKNKILTENRKVFDEICLNNTVRAEKKYSGKYSKKSYVSGKKKGIYICPVCKNKLYRSEDIYDSKTGWPAFTDTIDGYQNSTHVFANNITKELKCRKCGLHLGHRLFDGPTPTKIHDCLNSVCLHFIPKNSRRKRTRRKK